MPALEGQFLKEISVRFAGENHLRTQRKTQKTKLCAEVPERPPPKDPFFQLLVILTRFCLFSGSLGTFWTPGLVGGSLVGVWNGWGYGIAFFRALNFQISEPEIWANMRIDSRRSGHLRAETLGTFFHSTKPMDHVP